MKTDDNFINGLREIHDRLSGGNLHEGTESEENPIEKEEFMRMICDIEKLIQSQDQGAP